MIALIFGIPILVLIVKLAFPPTPTHPNFKLQTRKSVDNRYRKYYKVDKKSVRTRQLCIQNETGFSWSIENEAELNYIRGQAVNVSETSTERQQSVSQNVNET